jgi:sec-independent protein translocase protein TatB
MFGMGGSEIIVILIVALIFLGPDKLPGAAKSISKGIRDIKKQSRALQQQIESDEQIGGAIRDLKSALRGEELPVTPKHRIRPQPKLDNTIEKPALPEGESAEKAKFDWIGSHADEPHDGELPPELADKPAGVTLPAMAGEPDVTAAATPTDDNDLAALVKPASGTVAKGS